MIIRREQTDAMVADRERLYGQQLLAFFRGTMPQATAKLTEPELRELIAVGVGKARTYGIESTSGVTRFVGLMLLVSPRFDEDPAVRQFLVMPDLDPDLRIKFLSDLLAQRLRG